MQIAFVDIDRLSIFFLMKNSSKSF